MFSRNREKSLLEQETERVLRILNGQEIGSQEYVKTMKALTDLHKMREEETPKPVSRDTLAIVGANLLGILMVIRYENVNVIVSRAMSMILRLK